jgi:hypothetical protein
MSARPVRLPAARTQFPSTTPSSGYPKCWTLPKCFCVSGVWTHWRLQFGGEGATGASTNTLFLGVKFPNSPAYTASYFKKIRTGINYEINYQLDAIEYLFALSSFSSTCFGLTRPSSGAIGVTTQHTHAFNPNTLTTHYTHQ